MTRPNWIFAARDAQLPPPDLSWCWLFLGGRGAGKSHSMSAAVHMAVRAGISRIHLIAPTTADFHDVNLEGRSGILATCGRDPRPRWISSKRRLEWPNGAVAVMFSGEEPESLRGPQCELCVIDEIARMRYQQAVFDTMMLGLRLGDKPPRPDRDHAKDDPVHEAAGGDGRYPDHERLDLRQCRSPVTSVPEQGQGEMQELAAAE
jgi:phage terminase large subunit-like protein